jgi:LacI family transcriptional regulator
LEEAGIDVASVPVEQGYFTFRSGIVATERLLDRANPPTAIFASNDDMAAAAVGVAHRRGLHVPQDLSVVGFDDTSLATTIWPELTTIRQPIAAMAEEALTQLLARLRTGSSDDAALKEQILDYQLIVRESSASPGDPTARKPTTERGRAGGPTWR